MKKIDIDKLSEEQYTNLQNLYDFKIKTENLRDCEKFGFRLIDLLGCWKVDDLMEDDEFYYYPSGINLCKDEKDFYPEIEYHELFPKLK